MRNRIIWIVAAVLFCLPILSGVSLAATTNSVYMNGKKLSKSTSILWERTEYYLPLSYLDTEMDMVLTKNGSGSTAVYALKRGDISVTLKPNVNQIWVNGVARSVIQPLLIKNNIVYVGLRKIESAIGMKTSWDPLTNSIIVFTKSSGTSNQQVSISGETNNTTPSPSPSTQPSNSTATLTNIEYIDSGVEATALGATDVTDMYLPASKAGEFDRIVVDIKGITTKAGTLPAGKVYVNTLRYAQFTVNPNVVRVVIELKKATNYSVLTDLKTGKVKIIFGVSTPVTPVDNGKFKIVIDAGHGGKDPGSISFTKKYEKDFNLIMANKLYAKLIKLPNVQVIMTRSTDIYLTLEERAAIANKVQADLFISIHANISENPSVSGIETYYWDDQTILSPQSSKSVGSKEFASFVHSEIVKSTGSIDRKVRSNNYRVLVKTTMPAVLLELGFMSNKNEEAKLWTATVQNNIVNGITNSVQNYIRSK